jgi:hypothetical protein
VQVFSDGQGDEQHPDSAGLVDEGAAALLRFRDAIDTGKSGEPAVLGVIAGTGFGYVRPDGIAVIPAGALAS